MRGGVGAGGAGEKPRDVFPVSGTVFPLDLVICHAQLVGQADGGAAERQLEPAAADGGDGHAVAGEVIACLSSVCLRQRGERDGTAEQHGNGQNHGDESLHINILPLSSLREERVSICAEPTLCIQGMDDVAQLILGQRPVQVVVDIP